MTKSYKEQKLSKSKFLNQRSRYTISFPESNAAPNQEMNVCMPCQEKKGDLTQEKSSSDTEIPRQEGQKRRGKENRLWKKAFL